MVLIGLYLNNAARTSYQELVVQQLLEGEPVSRFMTTSPTVVPMDLDLRRWVEDYVYRRPERIFPVCSNDHLAGVITTRALGRYPVGEWPRHSVAEVMNPDVDALTVAPGADAAVALEKMQKTGSNTLLVVESGRLVGVANFDDLVRFVERKREPEEGR
jgi:CBS domain-containing protein